MGHEWQGKSPFPSAANVALFYKWLTTHRIVPQLMLSDMYGSVALVKASTDGSHIFASLHMVGLYSANLQDLT